MGYEKDCLFCKIGAGELPAEKVYEDDKYLGFKDINPKAKVHILLIPKSHTKDIVELAVIDEKALSEMAVIAKEIANENSNGEFRFFFNTGKSAGQVVFHTHAHIMNDVVKDEFTPLV
ncbi:MAG: HIT domain-containing protein [Bifidobacteriaceae bacterium]|jgi:histidine triad (HIT) family protein|nr:HIT domain-containing protein [Bifidobacteriaceae bacterium]